MSEKLIEDKYLFTFQDEKQLWIPREFIKKYPKLPFQDIIQHTEKYDDGSYYVDMPSLSMEKVISFLNEEIVDIFTLDLKDSYDIYKTLVEYSVSADKEKQNDLLFHVKELFYNYLKDNNYSIYNYCVKFSESRVPMELFNLEEKHIIIYDDYSSNIPLEYICPSCIQDIFPSLSELTIFVTTHYKKTELLLNPNSDEYIMEYYRFFNKNDYKIENPEEYEYYTESEIKEYNKISSLDLNKLYYSHKLIDSYNEKRKKINLPKLYKYIVNEDIYTNDYSKVEINREKDDYSNYDSIKIEYDSKTNDKKFFIIIVYTEHGISQLLCLPIYLSISKIILNSGYIIHYNPVIFMKLFEECIFDSLTTFSVYSIEMVTEQIDDNLLNKIMTTHVFPNVTELIYHNDYYDSFQLSSIKKECFPKLHIIDYNITENTIRIHGIGDNLKDETIRLFNYYAYTHSIHIEMINIVINDTHTCYYIYCFPRLNELLAKNLISFHKLAIDFSNFESFKKLDYIENNKQKVDSLFFQIKENYYNNASDSSDGSHNYDDSDDDDGSDDNDSDNYDDSDDNHNDNSYLSKIDERDSLERFLKSTILEHLNDLDISFDDNISVKYLTWISTLFNDNKFNTIHKLTINLSSMEEDLSSKYLTAYENIMIKLISKASIVELRFCYMTFINRLIPKGCFHNTTQLILDIKDIPDDNFCKLYTTKNFPKLKYINIYMFNSTSNYFFYDLNNSIFRCKYDSHLFMNTIIGTKGNDISDEKLNIYKHQMNNSLFIQENRVYYEINIEKK
ncbi:hypothetical protein WA158_005739 [Blastocystis sp. Blastoise]